MNKIGAISTGNAYSYKLSFKGVNSGSQNNTNGASDTFAAREQLLDTLGRAQINTHKPKNHKGHGFDFVIKDGITRIKETGRPFSGSITKNEDTSQGTRKIILNYKDGKLEKLTKYKAGSKEIDFYSDYSYSDDGKIKTYKTYKFNDLVGDFALWEKTTITPKIIANHHIGRIETSNTTLTIKDRRTHKLISQTTFKPSRLDKQSILAPQFEREMPYLTRRLMPEERIEFEKDGKTVKKTVAFKESLSRTEKTFENGSKKASSTIFYDRFNRPHKMIYEGIMEKPLILDKERASTRPSAVPYNLEVKFVTNQSVDLHKNNFRHNYEIVSSGKIASLTLRAAGTEMRLQNWFKDKSTRNSIKIETPATNSRMLISPEKTAFKTFFDLALDSESKNSQPGLDLSKFNEDFDKCVETMPAFLVSNQGHAAVYYPNTQTGDLLFHDIQINDNIDVSLRPRINEIYKQLSELCKKYNEGN